MAELNTASNPTSNQTSIGSAPTLAKKNPTFNDVVRYIQKELDPYLGSVFLGIEDLNTAITQGYIVDGIRVINLQADQIEADTVLSNRIYIGSDQLIELDGVNQQIKVTDDAGQVRVKIGKLGAATTDWGIDVLDKDGNLEFSSSTVTFIDGVIITDGSIVGTDKIQANSVSANEISVTNLAAINADLGTITAGTINATVSVNATAIDAGTLTADGSPVAIQITSSGALLMSSGGDAIFRSNATDYSAISFQSSGSVEVGRIQLDGAASNPTGLQIASLSGDNLTLTATGSGADVIISASDQVTVSPHIEGSGGGNFVVDSHCIPNADGTYDLGLDVTRQWADLHADTTTVPDLGFQNGWYIAEGYIYGAKDEDYLVLLDNEDNLRAVWTKGTFYTDTIKPLADCPLLNMRRVESITDVKRSKEHSGWTKINGAWEKDFKRYPRGKTIRSSDGKELTIEEKEIMAEEQNERLKQEKIEEKIKEHDKVLQDLEIKRLLLIGARDGLKQLLEEENDSGSEK